MKLFVFGSTGDLVKRKVLPALHEFKDLDIYVLGRKNLGNEEYNKEYCTKCSEQFKLKLNYIQISFEKDIYPQIENLLDKKENNYFYISMPPEFTMDLIKKIITIRNGGFKIKILIEKPFGSNLKEAEELKKIIEKENITKEVYLSDHYLFKKAIIDKKIFSFKKLNITVLEEIGLESRNYYDSVGALKDMIQSHFLNILHKMIKFSEKDVEIIKIEKGQYKDYKKELGKDSNTETYIKINLYIDEKEIEFETGKKFQKKESFMEIDGIKESLNSDITDYVNLFNNFFNNIKNKFPTIEDAIINWKIIENIRKDNLKLNIY